MLACDPSLDKIDAISLERLVDTSSIATSTNSYLPSAHKAWDKIKKFLSEEGLPMPSSFSWQGDYNINDNDTPSDILFGDHTIAGISVKTKGSTHKNNGLSDIPWGEDAFHFIAPAEFDAWWKAVVTDLMNHVKDNGSFFKKEKYAMYLQHDLFRIESKGKVGCFTPQQLLNQEVPIGYRRVIGDYYQSNKAHYEPLTGPLLKTVLPWMEDKILDDLTEEGRLCDLCGFCDRAYFVVNLDNDTVYYVSSKESKVKNLEGDMGDAPTKFGSGPCYNIKFRDRRNDTWATAKWYLRYHQGVFNTPAQHIQDLKNQEALWRKL